LGGEVPSRTGQLERISKNIKGEVSNLTALRGKRNGSLQLIVSNASWVGKVEFQYFGQMKRGGKQRRLVGGTILRV